MYAPTPTPTPTPAYTPAYPSAPPGPPPHGDRRRHWALIAGGVALALVAGAGAWFAFAGSDDDKSESAGPASSSGAPGTGQPPAPSTPAAPVDLNLAWSAPAGGSDSADPRGGWVGGKNIVVANENGVTVYDAATGAEGAPIAGLPASLKICETSAKPVGGVGLIGYEGASGDCDTVSAVDLAQGSVLWTHQVPEFEGAWEMTLAADGETAVVGAASSVFAYNLHGGTQMWTWTTPEAGTGIYRDNWDIRDVLASPTGVAVTLQRSETTSIKYVGGVAVLDPVNGVQRKLTALDNGPDSWPNLISASPVVVFDEWNATGVLGERDGKIIVYDDALTAVAELPVGGEDGIVFETSDLHDTNQYEASVLIRDGVLYTALGSAEDSRSVGAYDLATGKRTWSAPAGQPGYPTPVSVDGDGVVFTVSKSYSDQATLLRFPLAGGAPSVVHRLVAEDLSLDREGAVWVADGRVALFGGQTSKPPVQVFGAS
ncbi:PQQ-like beta-propeller repeat protein [Yinghuangia sp. ASG 101]|uniref:outer membrane protein assembly factor BamB family protein n=1 Tax=Yinghuangia sp. ASG 101 TaxID=2896848 RepID=UPI001E522B62|nr:PQQ-binding-like beta-propeller repeat protein [Yinghuangia sp. ASG 101]UGQ15459.1 PQQ-like beta-propeller repeat protein [Yinghuangia sp. ASG 101]